MFERIRKISREDEAHLPEFSSHAAARRYFVKIYGDNFVAVNSFLISDDRICYEYHLVLDPDAYAEGMRKLCVENGFSDGGEFLHSYQKIEIMDGGSVHILH